MGALARFIVGGSGLVIIYFVILPIVAIFVIGGILEVINFLLTGGGTIRGFTAIHNFGIGNTIKVLGVILIGLFIYGGKSRR